MKATGGSTMVLSALCIAVASGLAAAQDQTLRLSSNQAGDPGSNHSFQSQVSADGRFVAFWSYADDLVPNDTNLSADVFVFDREAGTLERVSVANDGSEANGGSTVPSISADGRYVAFSSVATNLIANDKNNHRDVFVRDRVAGTTVAVSVSTGGGLGNKDSSSSKICADGTRIVFVSEATNFDSGDTNGKSDIFVRDLVAGTTTLVSETQSGTNSNDYSWGVCISADGVHVAFYTHATNFPNAPINGGAYVKDLDTGYLERVDADSNGNYPLNGASPGGISSDGSLVLFDSYEALVPEDVNGAYDVYIRDRTHATTERVSLATGGGEITWGRTSAMSSDGRFVAFLAGGDDATSDDANGFTDVIVRDRLLDVSTLVTRGTLDERITHDCYLETSAGGAGGWLSDDGAQIAFHSDTADLVAGDATGLVDVFLRSLDRHPATSAHYGSGWPGTGGTIPTMDPKTLPYRGTTLEVDVTNSSGSATTAFVFIGFARGDVPTHFGGSLLVDWTSLFPVPLAASGFTLTGGLPTDYWANGLVIDLQAVELDPGASRGLSFTDGLELVLGDA